MPVTQHTDVADAVVITTGVDPVRKEVTMWPNFFTGFPFLFPTLGRINNNTLPTVGVTIMGQRLDTYDKMPTAMKNYLSLYGWHFSKKMCEWAVSKMEVENKTTKQKEKLVPIKKEEVEELLKKYGIKLEKDAGYDCVYVANMAKADYYKSSITDESRLALFLKDYIDDPDGYDGLPFTRFYAKTYVEDIKGHFVRNICNRRK